MTTPSSALRLLLTLGLAGCTANQAGERLSFTRDAVESLPQVPSDSRDASAPETIAAYPTLAEFFEQECFMPGGDDFCPAGTDVSGDSNPRKFTPMTLLGLIYHAEMYSGGLQTKCEHEALTLDRGAFLAHASTGADPTRFLLDDYSLLTCVERAAFGDPRVTRAFSTDATSSYQASLTTRYRVPYNGVAEPGQTDVFQVYVSRADGAPAFLAFNFAGANTMFSRAVLLVNLTSHRFVVKYLNSPGRALVAIGVGGVDRATGVPHPGYYSVKVDDPGGTITRCVDNRDGTIQPDEEACTVSRVPRSWTRAEAISTYLALAGDDRARVQAWLDQLENDDLLATEDSPTNASSGGDPELYFPERIR